MKTIPLTKGKTAIVDDKDYERVSRYNWQASKVGHCWYAQRSIKIDGRYSVQKMHSFILGTNERTDHIDHDGLNNRRCNLRKATPGQNVANARKFSGASKFKGVHLHDRSKTRTKPWRAQITFNGKRKNLGSFRSEIEAAKAYNDKALSVFGEFACLNSLPLK